MKKELRCDNCNKKLGEYDIENGQVEIICPRCDTKNILEVQLKPNESIKTG